MRGIELFDLPLDAWLLADRRPNELDGKLAPGGAELGALCIASLFSEVYDAANSLVVSFCLALCSKNKSRVRSWLWFRTGGGGLGGSDSGTAVLCGCLLGLELIIETSVRVARLGLGLRLWWEIGAPRGGFDLGLGATGAAVERRRGDVAERGDIERVAVWLRAVPPGVARCRIWPVELGGELL